MIASVLHRPYYCLLLVAAVLFGSLRACFCGAFSGGPLFLPGASSFRRVPSTSTPATTKQRPASPSSKPNGNTVGFGIAASQRDGTADNGEPQSPAALCSSTAPTRSSSNGSTNNNREQEPAPPLDDSRDNRSTRNFWQDNITDSRGECDSLQPPAFNLRRESLLFDERAATQRDNNARRLWEFCQAELPRVVHGGSSSANCDNKNNNNNKSDIDPVAALYNMVFVRLPVIVAGAVYAYSLAAGHPWIVDCGGGASEVPPLLVGLVLWIILR